MIQSIFKSKVSYCGVVLWRKIVVIVSGIASDYWRDGGVVSSGANESKSGKAVDLVRNDVSSPHRRSDGIEAKTFTWKASGRPQILESIWGLGHCLPGGDTLIDTILAPITLGDNKDILDLSANTGAVGRRLAARFGAYVTGLEVDEDFARYGAELSAQEGKSSQATVEVYNPANFFASKQYSFIVARELFYKIADKHKFFKEINKSLKPKEPRGQMVFTDYLLESDRVKNPAIAAWLAYESDARPVSLEEMIKTFGKNNVDLRVHEDLTDMYVNEIFKALSKFTQFLQKYPPDRDTKVMITREIELWSLRIAALKAGLKFYRFYAIKN